MDPLYSLFKIEVLNSPPILEGFQTGIGTYVKLSATLNPKMDGQVEHTIQTLDYMLSVCVIDFKGNSDDHLPLIEFLYNKATI